MAGGILCLDSEALICYNTIIGNAANFPYWDGDDGGGLYIQGSSPEVYRNIFFGNSATRIGGGIYSASEVYSNIEHCTFYANTAAYGGGAIACLESQYYVSELSVNNCILWANTAVGIIPGTAILNVSYCDIMGGWSGIGNLNAAPMFLNSPGGDFHLLWGSPCIDAGDPSSPLDPDSTRADMGAFYYDQSVGIAENPAFELPSNFLLHHCSPNPFNPTTAFSYQLSANSFVSLRVYDTAGRLVQTLVDGWREAGAHEVTFDGSGLAAGIYFARLRAGEYVGVEKMVLLK
ncbi:MAG TPA: T9SS type A sorting domain-containing protein, partial [bacterium]